MPLVESNCKPERRGEIAEEMDRLHNQVDRARNLIDRLIVRIGPATRCAEPICGKSVPMEGTSTGLGGSIQSARANLTTTLDDLGDLIDRIEL